MPTDEDLIAFAKLSAQRVKESILVDSGKTKVSEAIFHAMKLSTPGVNHIYGEYRHYNPNVNAIYVTITADQTDLLLKTIKDQNQTKKDVRQEKGLVMFIFGVEKSEDEKLSEVTDATKIVFAGG